jgi:hypothetical protein
VGAAVGLGVEAGDVDDADDLDVGWEQIRRGPDDVGDRERLLTRQVADRDRAVGADLRVDRLRNAVLEVRRYFGQVEVHPRGQRFHVPAGHQRAEVAEHYSGQHMQPGVGPHQLSTPFVVERAAHGRADRRYRVAVLRHQEEVVAADRPDDPRPYAAPQQHTLVRRLAAATGIERGPVEHDPALRIHPDDRRVPLPHRRIVQIQPMRVSVLIPVTAHVSVLSRVL